LSNNWCKNRNSRISFESIIPWKFVYSPFYKGFSGLLNPRDSNGLNENVQEIIETFHKGYFSSVHETVQQAALRAAKEKKLREETDIPYDERKSTKIGTRLPM